MPSETVKKSQWRKPRPRGRAGAALYIVFWLMDYDMNRLCVKRDGNARMRLRDSLASLPLSNTSMFLNTKLPST